MKLEFFSPSSFLKRFRAKASRIRSLPIDRSTLINKSLGWVLSVSALIGLGLVSISEGRDISFDLQNYHLYNPYAYLNDRILIDLFPADCFGTDHNPCIKNGISNPQRCSTPHSIHRDECDSLGPSWPPTDASAPVRLAPITPWLDWLNVGSLMLRSIPSIPNRTGVTPV